MNEEKPSSFIAFSSFWFFTLLQGRIRWAYGKSFQQFSLDQLSNCLQIQLRYGVGDAASPQRQSSIRKEARTEGLTYPILVSLGQDTSPTTCRPCLSLYYIVLPFASSSSLFMLHQAIIAFISNSLHEGNSRGGDSTLIAQEG